MTLHVVGLPHTQATIDFSACAYTQKVRRFIPMMEAQGFDVVLHQPLTVNEQASFGFHGPEDYLKIDFNPDLAIWQLANANVLSSINALKRPGDVVCLITGLPHQSLVNQVGLTCVEFGIGYSGICFNTFHVFESQAWRNFVYGRWNMDHQFFDDVIPNAYEIADFPVVEEPDDYYAFVGRTIDKKGYRVAEEVCRQLGKRLIIVGQGQTPEYGEYRGLQPYDEVIKIMSHAKALFVPTTYVAPFEGVHVEAQLCGTPVITTDQGVFTETVTNGVNGYRCRMYQDFVEAARLAPLLKRTRIAQAARLRYDTAVVGAQYARYFERLSTLSGDGWYAPSREVLSCP